MELRDEREAWNTYETFPDWIKSELFEEHIHPENTDNNYIYYSELNVVNVIKKLLEMNNKVN